MSIYEKVENLFNSTSIEKQFDELAVRRRWDLVKNTWKDATSDAEEAEVYEIELRIMSCHGDDTKEPCESRSIQDGHYFCNACGCGESELANIDVEEDESKLYYKNLCCPIRKPGFANSLRLTKEIAGRMSIDS